MRDFDMLKSKEMFQNYLKWRKDFRVDVLSKVLKFLFRSMLDYPESYMLIIVIVVI